MMCQWLSTNAGTTHWLGNWTPRPIERPQAPIILPTLPHFTLSQLKGHSPGLPLLRSITSHYRRNKMYTPKPKLRFLSEQLIREAAAFFLNPAHTYAKFRSQRIQLTNTCAVKLMMCQWLSTNAGTTHWRGNWTPKPTERPQARTILATVHYFTLPT